MRSEHLEVLKTMNENGLITKQAMKSIRGQVISMDDDARETYLRKLIS